MLDRFKLALGEYARLTDRQIFELYLHARKSDGSIDPAVPLPPEPKPTNPQAVKTETDGYESDRSAVDALSDALHLDGKKREELHGKLREKYGK